MDIVGKNPSKGVEVLEDKNKQEKEDAEVLNKGNRIYFNFINS